MKTYIGCSGYHYDSWKNVFYPNGLSKNNWLEYYAKYFNTVEINNTFYHMPEKEKLIDWKNRTPENFRITIKANRFFTHLKKLKMDNPFRKKLDEFQESLNVLEDRLGCILWQLPRNLHKNLDKLDTFCEALDMNMDHVLEFRHHSWFCEDVYDLLEDKKMILCILSAPDLPTEMKATSKIAYARFHGADKWYDYNYSDSELKKWKNQLLNLKVVDELYIYFNNDPNAWSAENAQKLKKEMEKVS